MSKIDENLRKYPLLYNMLRRSLQWLTPYLMSDEAFIKRTYNKRVGRELNLDNPKTLNEKIQWLKFNWRDDRVPVCADKYGVREYIKAEIGNDILNELYGVYDRVDEIDIDALPDAFVLKANHGCNWNIICKDKNKMNWDKELKIIDTWLHLNYFWSGREWMYKSIQPKIICEKYFSEEDGAPPRDYMFFCFNGEPYYIFVSLEIDGEFKADCYDVSWNKTEISSHFPTSDIIIPKPHNLDKMLEISRKLSKPFPLLRVDLYEVDQKIIFGEMTFSPGNGMERFSPLGTDEMLGDLLDLSGL